MEYENDINNLESRASKVGLKMLDLCERAGVPQSTFSRWKHRHNSPNLRNFTIQFSKLEAALDVYEIEMRDYLVALRGLPGSEKQEQAA